MFLIQIVIMMEFEKAHKIQEVNKGKGKGAPLYRHWGSVQAVRPIEGVEV